MAAARGLRLAVKMEELRQRETSCGWTHSTTTHPPSRVSDMPRVSVFYRALRGALRVHSFVGFRGGYYQVLRVVAAESRTDQIAIGKVFENNRPPSAATCPKRPSPALKDDGTAASGGTPRDATR